MRHAAKRDENEGELLKRARLNGWTVLQQNEAGRPDWLCMRRGEVRFVEVKMPDGTLTPKQAEVFPIYEANGCAIQIVRTPEDVDDALPSAAKSDATSRRKSRE